MKLKFSFLLVALMASLFLFAQKPVFISTKGQEVIGTDGKPFLMRGTNLGNWLVPEGYMFHFKKATSPRLINQAFNELIGEEATSRFWKKFLDTYITHDDIKYLKSTGINSIRIPFNYRLFTNENYMGDNDSTRGFTYLDRAIEWCRQEGLYVMLDMHCAPGGQTGDNIDDGYGYPYLFTDEGAQQKTIDIWKRIAAHYADDTLILGYDVLNEPIAHYFDTAFLNPKLEPLYKRIVSAVREADPHHIILLGGAQWDSNFRIFGKPFANNLIYTFHKYWTATDKSVIQDYIDFRDKYNVPLYCGETGENNDQWVKEFRQTLEANNIGWHFWPYKKLSNTRGFATFDVPEYYTQVIAYADTTRNSFADIRAFRPANTAQIVKALNGYLENAQFKNCHKNEGYIRALGLKP